MQTRPVTRNDEITFRRCEVLSLCVCVAVGVSVCVFQHNLCMLTQSVCVKQKTFEIAHAIAVILNAVRLI